MKLFSRSPKQASAAVQGLYVSPFERFLNEYKSTHPDVDTKQMEGRALLWDKLPMPGQTTDEPYGAAGMPQPRYVYYSGDE